MAIMCTYCGLTHHEADEHDICTRCHALLPILNKEEQRVDDSKNCDHTLLGEHQIPCPSCGEFNAFSREYCTWCGTPMAVITHVVELHNTNPRGPFLETWRVFGIETRMVARSWEMQLLADIQHRTVHHNTTSFVRVTGHTGMGKSRLFAEFRRTLDKNFSEALVIQTESRDDAGGAFSMFSRLFKKRFYIAEQDAPAIAKRKFFEAVTAIMRDPKDSERVAHWIGHLIGLPCESSYFIDEDTVFDQRCYEAVAELLTHDAKSTPLIFVLEDLQYAKEQSLKLITYLREHLKDSPILFLLSCNSKDICSKPLLRNLFVDSEISLKKLTDEQVSTFIRQTLYKAEHVPDLLVHKIVESAHGNPLAVEEMLRVLISEGTIDTSQQTWFIHTHKLKKLTLPTTVEAAVHARLYALSDEEHSLLSMASCVGDSFWPDLIVCLQRLLDEKTTRNDTYWQNEVTTAHVQNILETLERKDMVRWREDTSVSTHTEVYFKHRTERQALYQSLDSKERQRNHRIIAQWLDREATGSGGHFDEFIARHYDRARCLEQAAHKYIQAGRQAWQHYQNRKAIDLFTRGLSYLSDAHIALKISAFHDLGSIHDILGEFNQSLVYYRELLRYAWLTNNKSKGGVAYNKIGRVFRKLGSFDDAIFALRKALHLFHASNDIKGIASTLDDMGKIHWIRGNYDHALRYYLAGLSLRRQIEDKRSIALSLNHLGSLHLQRGGFKEAMTHFREALKLRQEIDDHQGVAESFNNLGILCMEREEHKHAITLFEEALGIVTQIGYRALKGFVLNNLGEAHLLLKNYDRATKLLGEAFDVAFESGEKRLLFDILRNQGKIALKTSGREEALDFMDKALDIAKSLDSAVLLGLGLQSMADIHAHYIFHNEHKEESTQLAEEHYKEAINILNDVGSEGQLGKCLSSYGHYLLECEHIMQGKQQIQRAQEIFDRLEMRKLWNANNMLIKSL